MVVLIGIMVIGWTVLTNVTRDHGSMQRLLVGPCSMVKKDPSLKFKGAK